MPVRLTTITLRNLKPKPVQYEVMDSRNRGFGIRINPKGTKTWIYRYRFCGEIHRMKIGDYPSMSIADARARYAESVTVHRNGTDPGSQQQERKRVEREAIIVSELSKEYIERYAKPKKRSWREDERIIEKDINPRFGKIKAKNIDRRDIILLLDEIVDRGTPIQANRTLSCISRMFNYGVEKALIEHSPCIRIKKPSAENQRSRKFNDEEIGIFWTRLDITPMSELVRLALRLQLVLAQRKGEIILSEWPHVDFANKMLDIPKENAKNKIAVRIPLPPLALKIYTRLKELNGGEKWVFKSTGKLGHLRGDVINEALRNNLNVIGLPYFCPHDLRRTAASHLSELGTPRLILDKILNHVDRSTTSVYDQYSYDKEKRAALNKWSRKIQTIVNKAT